MLVIKRDKGGTGSACLIRVYLNGLPAADMKVGETVRAYVPPADYVISASLRGALCGTRMREQTTSVASGETKSFRIGFSGSGEFFVDPTAF